MPVPRVTVLPLDAWEHQAAHAYLTGRPEVSVVDARADVLLVLARSLDADVLHALVAAVDAGGGRARLVLVTDDVGDVAADRLGRLGVSHVLPRSTATWDEVVAALRDRTRHTRPGPVRHVRPSVGGGRASARSALSAREVEVLRMLADGSTTAEIGAALHFSERTIKNVLGGVVGRFGLRNRVQAVAYAMRTGAI